MSAVEVISDGLGVARRRITISTAGWADEIRQMGEEKQRVKLAVSLHSVNDETRSLLMPLNKKFNVEALRSSIEYYYAQTKQRVTFEYIFFDGVNDSNGDIAELIKFARRIPCKINVIPFHSISFAHPSGLGARLRPSPRINAIVETLRNQNLTVMIRSNAGEDIDAACGQLAVNVRRTSRFSSRPSARKRVSTLPRLQTSRTVE
ncbi:MAG: hypothetical protein HY708_01800 [Ignavibacteriae bacterium]|nr:hypothetical protein [Ignavibacteriota bacterium]